jgi:Delta7-sterol 5-desaturase
MAPTSLPTLVALTASFFVGSTVVGVAIGFALERALAHKRVWSLPLAEGQLVHELKGNAVFLLVATGTFSAALASEIVRFGEDSTARALGTFAALSVGFQLFYYWLHRLLHTRRLIRFHRYHHESRVTTPLSGQSMSAVEALGWMIGYVGIPLAISQVVPISATGWAAYIAYNVIGNIVGHANCEIVPATRRVRLNALFGATFVFHALHHARWTGHYGFAAAWTDRLFGTEWADWPALHAKIRSGRPLQSFRERIGEG